MKPVTRIFPSIRKNGLRQRALILSILVCSLAVQSAQAYRVVAYWQGPDAGTMEIQNNSVGGWYIEIPEQACGFRLIKPNGWDDAWHFTDGWVLSDYDPANSSENQLLPDALSIEAIGPANGNCEEAQWQFLTPATVMNPGHHAPAGTGAFVAEFFDPDDIEWLDESGLPIDVDVPEPSEPGEPVDVCDLAPEFCEIPSSFLDCIQDWEGGWECNDSANGTGMVVSLATLIQGYSETATRALRLSTGAEDPSVGLKQAQRAVRAVQSASEVMAELARRMPRLEREVYSRTRKPATRLLTRHAAGAVGIMKANFAACEQTVQAAERDFFASRTLRIVSREAAKGVETVFEGELVGIEPAFETVDPAQRCTAAALLAHEAAHTVQQLRTWALPAEVK